MNLWEYREYLAFWVIGLVGLAGSAMCSGIETGCYTLNRVRLALRAGAVPPDSRAVILSQELSRPDRFVAVCLVSNNIFCYFISLGATSILGGWELSDVKLAVVNTVIVAPLLFLFGEAVPKELFRLEADRLTYRFARVLHVLRLLLTYVGIVPMFIGLTNLVARVSGTLNSHEPGETKQRIAALLKEGQESGALSESQASLVDRAISLATLAVRDEMIPWAHVRAIGIDSTPAAVRHLFATLPHARLPVTDKAGHVVGIVRQIDLYTRPDATLRELLLEPARLTPATSLQLAIGVLAGNPSRLGIVEVDETPVGMVTAKDLVEPLTGELPDL